MTTRILGPTGRTRRRRIALLVPLAALAALVLAIGSFGSNTQLGNFEIEGDQRSGSFVGGGGVPPTVTGEDWLQGPAGTAALQCVDNDPPSDCLADNYGLVDEVEDGPGTGLGELFRDWLKVGDLALGFTDDQTTFTQGDKENDNANTICPPGSPAPPCVTDTPWHIVHGSTPPNKDDLFDVAVNTIVSGNQSELDIGMVRTNNNGSSHLDFELNKSNWLPGTTTSSVACVTNTTGITGFRCPKRTEGDLLVSFEIAPDGSAAIRVFVWDVTGGIDAGSGKRGAAGSTVNCDGALLPFKDKPCPWEEISPPLSAGGVATIQTAVNANDIPAPPWGFRNPDGTANPTIPVGGWFEAGIDLDALGFPPSCPGFGVASAKARSSGESVTSALTDLAGPFPVDLNTCGKITIIKDTQPDHVADFSYTTTGTGLSGFVLDDDDTLAVPSATPDTKVFTQISPGTYSVTEGSSTTHNLQSINCVSTGTGTSTSTSGATANITLGSKGEVTCTFVNVPKTGAIKIHKQSVKGNAPLSGVGFTITAGPTSVTGERFTDANGDICVDGLLFGTYTITETTVPTGYSGEGPKNVAVDNGATCAETTYVGETVTFNNTPLSSIQVIFTSLAGVDVTKAQIVCKQGTTALTPAPPGEDGAADDDATPVFDDIDETFTNLSPGTYDCKVVVDP